MKKYWSSSPAHTQQHLEKALLENFYTGLMQTFKMRIQTLQTHSELDPETDTEQYVKSFPVIAGHLERLCECFETIEFQQFDFKVIVERVFERWVHTM